MILLLLSPEDAASIMSEKRIKTFYETPFTVLLKWFQKKKITFLNLVLSFLCFQFAW